VLLAPAGTPKSILNKVSSDLAEVIQAPDIKSKFPADNLESSTPDDLQRFLQTEAETWGGIAKRAGLRID
jgi:tripartite-type tricarboxylate transporter receptor subunit TctC